MIGKLIYPASTGVLVMVVGGGGLQGQPKSFFEEEWLSSPWERESRLHPPGGMGKNSTVQSKPSCSQEDS